MDRSARRFDVETFASTSTMTSRTRPTEPDPTDRVAFEAFGVTLREELAPRGVLESIYVLGRGRSFRTRRLDNLIRAGADRFVIYGEAGAERIEDRLSDRDVSISIVGRLDDCPRRVRCIRFPERALRDETARPERVARQVVGVQRVVEHKRAAKVGAQVVEQRGGGENAHGR